MAFNVFPTLNMLRNTYNSISGALLTYFINNKLLNIWIGFNFRSFLIIELKLVTELHPGIFLYANLIISLDNMFTGRIAVLKRKSVLSLNTFCKISFQKTILIYIQTNSAVSSSPLQSELYNLLCFSRKIVKYYCILIVVWFLLFVTRVINCTSNVYSLCV